MSSVTRVRNSWEMGEAPSVVSVYQRSATGSTETPRRPGCRLRGREIR